MCHVSCFMYVSRGSFVRKDRLRLSGPHQAGVAGHAVQNRRARASSETRWSTSVAHLISIAVHHDANVGRLGRGHGVVGHLGAALIRKVFGVVLHRRRASGAGTQIENAWHEEDKARHGHHTRMTHAGWIKTAATIGAHLLFHSKHAIACCRSLCAETLDSAETVSR